MATREDYIEAAGGLEAAIKNEGAVLSIGRELLPQCAQDVLDDFAYEPSSAYWDFLITQLSDLE